MTRRDADMACEALARATAREPARTSRLHDVVTIAQDLAVGRGADRVEACDLEQAAAIARTEVTS